jgi:hypothetical protein
MSKMATKIQSSMILKFSSIFNEIYLLEFAISQYGGRIQDAIPTFKCFLEKCIAIVFQRKTFKNKFFKMAAEARTWKNNLPF